MSFAYSAIPLNEQRGDGDLSSVPASPLTPAPSTAFGDAADASSLRARKTPAATSQQDVTKTETKTVSKKSKRGKMSKEDEDRYKSEGFWKDLRTGKWMLIPSEPLRVLFPTEHILIQSHYSFMFTALNPSVARVLQSPVHPYQPGSTILPSCLPPKHPRPIPRSSAGTGWCVIQLEHPSSHHSESHAAVPLLEWSRAEECSGWNGKDG